MMPLNHRRKKSTAGYKGSRSWEKINRLMHMDDIKLFAKNEKEQETLIIFTQPLLSRRIWHKVNF